MAATANASSLHNVFVYGTLMADEVVRTILKRVPPASPAVLNDYHRFSIKGRVYPAILPAESKKVKGRVLLGITDQELDKLDSFEDVEYERRTVEISLLDKSEKLLANAYVWSDKNDPNLYSEWDFEEWKRLHKKDFVTMTLGFMDDLEQPDSKTRVATYESYFHQGQSA
ncbi:AIG2-like protein D isoform X1 [Musa acuminata AAA Group]|uniref:AIG2-like protein D isoform X1 n=1 Tax=Musa acuminata AAA Group TaxID=214697 RepID=UPI0031D15A1E